MRRRKLVSASHLIACPTKCIWGCRTCFCFFWQIYSTTGLFWKPSLDMSLRAWLYYWRKVLTMFGRAGMSLGSQLPNSVKDFDPSLPETLADCCRWSARNWQEIHSKGKIDPEQFVRLLFWFILISPRHLIGWTIGFWWVFWKSPDLNQSSADGWAYCANPLYQSCRAIASLLRSNSWFGRADSWPFFLMCSLLASVPKA